MSELIGDWKDEPPRSGYFPTDRYEQGYRNGESNREADASAYHEEVLGHEPSCRCPLGAFLAHVGWY